MSKKSGLIDFIDLGVNVVQMAQMVELNDQLNELKKLKSSASNLQIIKTSQEKLESVLREYVFDTETRLDFLSDFVDSAPSPVFVITDIIDSDSEELGIGPSAFTQFVDKDRVKQFRSRVKSLNEQAFDNLTEDEKTDIKNSFDLVDKIYLLDELIEAKKTEEKIAKLIDRDNLGHLDSEPAKSFSRWRVSGFVSAFFTILLIGIAIANEDVNYIVALLILLSLSVFVYSVWRITDNPEDSISADNVLISLRKTLPDEKRFEELYSIFGEKRSSSEYESLREEYKDEIKRNILCDRDGNPLPKM